MGKVMFTLTMDPDAGSNLNYPIHLPKQKIELWQVVY